MKVCTVAALKQCVLRTALAEIVGGVRWEESIEGVKFR